MTEVTFKQRREPDNSLLVLNQALMDALREYLPDESTVAIRFDLPDTETPPEIPTVSVFLYQLQEDLELRAGEPRQYVPEQKKFLPGRVYIRCSYLITFWDTVDASGADAPAAGPSSQSLQIINCILNALINNRELPGGVSCYTRLMPSEHLNTLGNFWQALGNQPRVCLSYDVTIRMRLSDRNEQAEPVQELIGRVVPKAEEDALE
ncbi:TPA: DUF4255 domain-containing protein [Pseudomonas aeruginosa]|nr:DUF4255 domain-containing protein [Pseudomonas aeruginosa]